ncbi:MAG: glycosyltransferase family 1 protein [Rhizobiaceae bacterium]
MTGQTKLLVDGVFFQRASTGIARVWRSILPQMAKRVDIRILDRGNTPPLEGVEAVPFPSYLTKMIGPTAAESILIEQLCRDWGAHVFASTYYTSALSTPGLQMVYDMIPEVMNMDMSHRDWQDKEIALLWARAHVCISHNTQADLLRLYPEIDPIRTTVAHCGIDPGVFFPRPAKEIAAFRASHGLNGPYLMMVGSRIQYQGYKNGAHFFEALADMRWRNDLTLLFAGGEPDLPEVTMGGRRIPVKRLSLSDDDLARAYSGAEALIYPSLYEGFGMPPAEAMACGCPVITTDHGSLAEVVGNAGIKVSGHDLEEMRKALDAVRDPVMRARLIEAGQERSKMFRWDRMAEHVGDEVIKLAQDSADGRFNKFLGEWAKLRRLQADTDY